MKINVTGWMSGAELMIVTACGACMAAAFPCAGGPVEQPSDAAPEPAVQLMLNSVNAWNGSGGKWRGEEEAIPHFTVKMLFRCQAPWKVACVRPEQTRLELLDSLGNRASRVQARYGSSSEGRWPVFPELPRLYVDGAGWLPHRKARWVEVRGKVAAVISDRDEETEVVKIQLKKGIRIPVILKNAALDGGDVHSELAVNEIPSSLSSQGAEFLVAVSLSLPPGCAVRELKFEGKEAQEQGEGSLLWPLEVRSGKTVWSGVVYLKKGEGVWAQVRIRYAAGLKEVIMPFSFRVGMNGMIHEGASSRERRKMEGNRKE